MKFEHKSVLLSETVDGLNIKPNGIYVDGTIGGGGHSLEICKKLSSQGRLIGFDQDLEAIEASKKKIGEYLNITLIHENFVFMAEELMRLGIQKVDGILLDLGVSSHQLDSVDRGFSYMEDTVLDMRMDARQEKTASDIVNEYSESELARILKEYGEERYARKLAFAICQKRAEGKISRTGELVDIIKKTIPMKAQQLGGHPAKRTFQAIRIELNSELTVLENSIDDMMNLLNPKGRFCIITFHSLEDRIVKNKFKMYENPCTCPPNFPVCVCGKKAIGKRINTKVIVASEEETAKNSRAKSAKLRIIERI